MMNEPSVCDDTRTVGAADNALAVNGMNPMKENGEARESVTTVCAVDVPSVTVSSVLDVTFVHFDSPRRDYPAMMLLVGLEVGD
jgi:hypothetical protein